MHLAEEKVFFWIIIGVFSVTVLLMSFIGIHYHVFDTALLMISLSILGRMIYVLFRKRRVSVDLLMGVAGISTWYLHVYVEGFLIFALYSLSELVEEYSEIYAKRKLTSIQELLPSIIEVKLDNRIVEKRLEEIEIGDLILVKPGNTVPVDGVIVDGSSSFDTSYLTGESEPVVLRVGDNVHSGYVNKERLVIVKALRKPSESMLQLLVREAEKALTRKASIQRFIEKFSQPYTFIVLALFGIASNYLDLYRSLSILLAGCPSAFILSTSTATALSITMLGRRSVVVRGGAVLERTSKIRTIVLDKTGTITLGRMRVTSVRSVDGVGEEDVLRLAGGAAKASDHPVSRVLARYSNLIPSRAVEYPGQGVKALVEGKEVIIGSRGFIRRNSSLREDLVECGIGAVEVHVVVDGKYYGVVCLDEELTDEVFRVIDELKNIGLRIIIASGDRVERVEKVASLLGIKEYYGELSPDDKRRLVVDIKRENGVVGFVGDGVNDVEAIAEADVGMAIGSLRIVSNIGDVVFVKGIEPLPRFIRFARRYMNTIYLAIALITVVKLSSMILGLTGTVPLWFVVGLGDDGSTLLSIAVISYFLGRSIL